MSISTSSKLLRMKYYTKKKKLQNTSYALDHPFKSPPARWQQAGMQGNVERSGHEKGKEKRSVKGMRGERRGNESRGERGR